MKRTSGISLLKRKQVLARHYLRHACVHIHFVHLSIKNSHACVCIRLLLSFLGLDVLVCNSKLCGLHPDDKISAYIIHLFLFIVLVSYIY